MEAVTEQPIKKFKQNSSSPESLLATNRWLKSLRTLGTRLVFQPNLFSGEWMFVLKIPTPDHVIVDDNI